MLRVPQTVPSLPSSGPLSASSDNPVHQKRKSNGTSSGRSEDRSSQGHASSGNPSSREPSSRLPSSRLPSSRLPSSRLPSSRSLLSEDPSSLNPESRQASSRTPSSHTKLSKDPSSRDPSSRDRVSRDPSSRDPASRGVRFAEVADPKPVLATRGERLSVGTLRATVKFLGRYRKPLKPKPKPKPKPPEGFVSWKVEAWIREILEDRFNDYKYTPESAGEDAKLTSTQILDTAKSRGMGRYKFVCYVALGDDSHQGLEVATRWLWDTARDDYACVTHVTKDFYVVAILHAVYFE